MKVWAMIPGFNPHPAVRLGATAVRLCGDRRGKGFNPHPAVRLGATKVDEVADQILNVSILTQP